MDELIRSEVYDSRLPHWASVRHWTTGQKRMQNRERTAWEQQKYKMKPETVPGERSGLTAEGFALWDWISRGAIWSARAWPWNATDMHSKTIGSTNTTKHCKNMQDCKNMQAKQSTTKQGEKNEKQLMCPCLYSVSSILEVCRVSRISWRLWKGLSLDIVSCRHMSRRFQPQTRIDSSWICLVDILVVHVHQKKWLNLRWNHQRHIICASGVATEMGYGSRITDHSLKWITLLFAASVPVASPNTNICSPPASLTRPLPLRHSCAFAYTQVARP